LLQQLLLSKKVNTTNARSTVGTSTEIYDYMKLLLQSWENFFTISGLEVKKNTVTDVVADVQKLDLKVNGYYLLPFTLKRKKLEDKLKVLLQQGFREFLWVTK
jgi:excinuclease ABC subunit A